MVFRYARHNGVAAKHNFDVYHWIFRYSRHNVWLESTLDIALWGKSEMAAICENQKKNIIVNRMEEYS